MQKILFKVGLVTVNYYILIFKHTIWEFQFIFFLLFLGSFFTSHFLVCFKETKKSGEKKVLHKNKFIFSQHLKNCGLLDCKRIIKKARKNKQTK